MAPEGLQQIEQAAASAPRVAAPGAAPAAAPAPAAPAAPAASTLRMRAAAERVEPRLDDSVERDVEKLAMSTLSFQDYVRERMLKRRQAALEAAAPAAPPADTREPMRLVARRERDPAGAAPPAGAALPRLADPVPPPRSEAAAPQRRESAAMREPQRPVAPPALADAAPARHEQAQMLTSCARCAASSSSASARWPSWKSCSASRARPR
jgi:flagellar biosynthesis protein FlhF